MSLIFCDGFDDGLQGLGKYQTWGGLLTTPGRHGGNCLRMSGFNPLIARRQVDAADEHATMTVGFAFQGNNGLSFEHDGGSGNNTGHFSFMSDAGTTVHLTLTLTGGITPTIKVYRGTVGGTLLATGTVPTWITGQWYYCEFQATLSDTVGVITVKLNGATVINLTGQDTKNGGTKTVFDSFQFNHNWTVNSGVDMYYDDVYVTNGAGSANNGFLGDITVETLLPNGDGATNQFLGSDGNSVSNYALVNEAGAPVTTSYVEDGTTTERDLYAYGDLATASGPVYGVQVASYAQASASGARNLKNAVRSGTTVATSTTKPLVTTYLPALSIQEVDPSTSAAWDIAGINAAQFGVEVA